MEDTKLRFVKNVADVCIQKTFNGVGFNEPSNRNQK